MKGFEGSLRWYIQLLFFILPLPLFSQSITLEKVQRMARENYPLIRQKDLVKKTEGLNISNLNKNFLPQVVVNGQAHYQSDVTTVDVTIPGVKFDVLSKDQYRVTADVNQLIYDGGVIKQQKTIAELTAVVDDQQVEVELYALKERVNDVYLTILYTEEQIKQIDLVKEDLETGLKKVDAQVLNGTAFRSSSNILKAELLRTDQRLINLQSSREALIETLELFINQQLPDRINFETPAVPAALNNEITRPEIKLFNDQHTLLDQQNKLITARNLPRTSLFFQGGYGRPGLDMFKNDFSPYYLTGIRLNWSLGGYYTKRNDKDLVKVNQDIVDTKKDAFLLNTKSQLATQQNEIEKMQELIRSDKEIIELRRSVTNAAKAQLENGVMSASDYLTEVNEEDQARRIMIAHELQLLQAQIKYQTIKGE